MLFLVSRNETWDHESPRQTATDRTSETASPKEAESPELNRTMSTFLTERKSTMTQIISNKSPAELISLSESEDRTVVAMSGSIDAQLHDDCDGETHYTEEINGRMAEIHEYWGETWRVHTVQYLETVEQADEARSVA